MINQKVIDHCVTAAWCDEKDELLKNLQGEFEKHGVQKNDYSLEFIVETTSSKKEKDAFCMTYQLEILTDVLLSFIVSSGVLTTDDAKELWEAVQCSPNDDFSNLRKLLKSLINKNKEKKHD